MDEPLHISTLPAESLDQALITRLFRILYAVRPLYIAAGQGWSRRQKLAEMKHTPSLMYKIAYSGKEILGFISYVLNQHLDGFDSPVTYIWELHIAPASKRLGLGKRLVGAVLRETERQIVLRTFRCNTAAIKFYKAMGLKENKALSNSSSLIMANACESNVPASLSLIT